MNLHDQIAAAVQGYADQLPDDALVLRTVLLALAEDMAPYVANALGLMQDYGVRTDFGTGAAELTDEFDDPAMAAERVKILRRVDERRESNVLRELVTRVYSAWMPVVEPEVEADLAALVLGETGE